MKTHRLPRIFLVLLGFVATSLASAAEKVYTEGSVWELTFVRTKYGATDDYMKSLQVTYKQEMDAAVKDGLILSYKVLSTTAANKQDWNMVLMIEYKNMAALDGLSDKMEALAAKTVGDDNTQKQLLVKRSEVREILGGKLCRELIFK